MNYNSPFRLIGERGNNAFAYEQRGPEPLLYVPEIRSGKLEDLCIGDQVVFEDLDENGRMESSKGLKFFLRTELNGVPVIVSDNHNHALYFWYEALNNGLIKNGARLVHIDQHKDYREASEVLKSRDLEEVFRFTNEVCNVGNYIRPAEENGLVGEVLFVTSDAALDDMRWMQESNKILNIDLDFFATEMEYIDFEKARDFILAHAKTASIITVATSPFFIEQERALEAFKSLFFR